MGDWLADAVDVAEPVALLVPLRVDVADDVPEDVEDRVRVAVPECVAVALFDVVGVDDTVIVEVRDIVPEEEPEEDDVELEDRVSVIVDVEEDVDVIVVVDEDVEVIDEVAAELDITLTLDAAASEEMTI